MLKQLKLSLYDDLYYTCADYPDQSGRIIGGEDARIGEFPWQAMLAKKRWVCEGLKCYIEIQQDCGGTLLLPQFVITAAHCLKRKTPDQILIGMD